MSEDTRAPAAPVEESEKNPDEDPIVVQSLGLDERVALLEEEVRGLKTSLYAIPGALEKEKLEIRKNLEAFEGIQSSFKEVSEQADKSSKSVNNLERRVDGVKKNATSGVVASILIFSIMLIISLFIRTP